MEDLKDIMLRIEMESQIKHLKKNRKAEYLSNIIADNLNLGKKKRYKIEKILRKYL